MWPVVVAESVVAISWVGEPSVPSDDYQNFISDDVSITSMLAPEARPKMATTPSGATTSDTKVLFPTVDMPLPFLISPQLSPPRSTLMASSPA